jgi:hypothetical protein
MQNQINTIPITQFIQQVRSAELGQTKEIKMTLPQARMLSYALTEVLAKLTRDYETLFNDLKRSVGEEVVTVTMDGGGFEESK